MIYERMRRQKALGRPYVAKTVPLHATEALVGEEV
jgi:hypothetical protein